jgi:hypothetical protein
MLFMPNINMVENFHHCGETNMSGTTGLKARVALGHDVATEKQERKTEAVAKLKPD